MAVVLNRPQVVVTVETAPPGRDSASAAARGHFAGLTYRGTAAPEVVTSVAEFERLYGPRQSWSVLYDAAAVFFAEGGGELVVSRVVGPSAVSSSVDVDDQQGSPETAVTVTAVSAGVWGDDIDVTFANGAATGQTSMTVEYLGVPVEVYTDLSPADLVTASLESDFVRVTIGDTTATGDQARPAVGEVSLASGDDDRGNITDDEWAAAFAALDDSYGPGHVAAPGETSGTRLQQAADHAEEFNRVALCDTSSTVATAVAAATALRAAASDASYAALFSGGLTARVGGVVRSVPASAVAAGVIARRDRTGGVNEPAAGVNGTTSTVVDAPVYTAAERNTLTVGGVNAWKSVDGSVRLYSFRGVTLGEWKYLSNVRLRMDIVREATAIAERYLFAQLDGQGRTIAEFKGDLVGMLAGYYDDGALFGATAADAFVVSTADNTASTAANGELHARLGVRPSPFGELVQIVVTAFQADQPVSA